MQEMTHRAHVFNKNWGGEGGHASAPPSRPGTHSGHPGVRIRRTSLKPTDFLNQKVAKYAKIPHESYQK